MRMGRCGRRQHLERCSVAATTAFVWSVLFIVVWQWESSVVEALRRLPPSREAGTIASEQHRRLLLEQELSGEVNDGDSRVLETAEEEVGLDLPSPEDHLVQSLPYLADGSFPTKHYAGHLPGSAADGGNDKRMFYWLFEPDFGDGEKKAVADEDVPLLIWLNGGPGCSSMDGLWIENGPFRLKPSESEGGGKWTIDVHPHSWHNLPAWVLYVDQPVGTGLSFTRKERYCKNDRDINEDFHFFLRQFLLVYADFFLQAHPASDTEGLGLPTLHTLKRPLYFSGESHAGHYIPSMMDFFLQRNDDYQRAHGISQDASGNAEELDRSGNRRDTAEVSTSDLPPGPHVLIPPAGAAIGNGWVDPFHQYAAAEAAFGMGLIDLAQKTYLDQMEKQCHQELDNGKEAPDSCYDLLDVVVNQSLGSSSAFKVSQYDNRKVEPSSGDHIFPEGHTDVEAYLGGSESDPKMDDITVEDVLTALHADEILKTSQKYVECSNPPYDALSNQDSWGVVDELVRVLDHPSQPKILFYNGVNDLICNHAGNERFLNFLPWSQRREWIVAPRYAWDGPKAASDPGPPAGYSKSIRNLLFLKVLSSGHMVPMDQPLVALDMMKRFLWNFETGFQTGHQKINAKDPTQEEVDDKKDDENDDAKGQQNECQPCPTCGAGTSENENSDFSKAATLHLLPQQEDGLGDAPSESVAAVRLEEFQDLPLVLSSLVVLLLGAVVVVRVTALLLSRRTARPSSLQL